MGLEPSPALAPTTLCYGLRFLVVLSSFVVQSLRRVRLFVTPWTAARQASLSFTISRSLLKLMSIESMMPSNHLILCCPLLPLPLDPSLHFLPFPDLPEALPLHHSPLLILPIEQSNGILKNREGRSDYFSVRGQGGPL